MLTDSDSDEQFESADEDLDYEIEEQSHASAPQSKKAKDEALDELSKLNIKEIPIHQDSTSKTEPFVKVEEGIIALKGSNTKTILSQSDNDESVKSLDCIKNSCVNKQDIPMQAPIIAVPFVEEIKSADHSQSDTIQAISKQDEKINALDSLSSKEDCKDSLLAAVKPSTDCDGWDVDVDSDIGDFIPNIESNLASNTNNETMQGGKAFSRVGDTLTSKGDVKNNENTSKEKDVDGWDVEVEDGFEIPVDLNKGTTDHFPFSLTTPLQKLTNNKEDSWGGWGAWGGVGNILSSATTGMTSLTSQVSHGFSQVLGAPDPTELARLDSQLSEHQTQDQQILINTKQDNSDSRPASEDVSATGLFSLSQLTRLVETTGSKVISGGLDTLENLGKKTMEVLQDGDPGLKKKRAILFPHQDKPVLSQVLRDAKGRLESETSCSDIQEGVTYNPKSTGQSSNPAKNLHFESLLDDYQGLAHLEALEMLSKQCSVKLHNALMAKSGDERKTQEVNDFQETLQQIREMCQVEDATDPADSNDEDEDDDVMGFDEKVQEIVRLYDLTSKLNCDRLIQVNRKITLQVDRLPLQSSCDEIYSQCLHSMAEFTSVAMDVFHKSANLLLLKTKHRTVDETDALTQFTYLLCSRITKLSSVYSQAMLTLDKDTGLITNVYLEAANSCSYLQDASQLVIPVLQIVAIPGAS